nr:hypothetical protein ZK402.4 - Caenorhabditis elegans [Caenorhabditis elegans]
MEEVDETDLFLQSDQAGDQGRAVGSGSTKEA